MTNSPDYRMYIEEKFEGISKLMNAQFTIVHDKLNSIETQTKKTNGRVGILEDKMEKEEKDLLMHSVNCNQAREIKIIKENVEVVKGKLSDEILIKKTDKEKRIEERAEWQKWVQTGAFIIAAITLIITAYFSYYNSKLPAQLEETKKEINKNIELQEGISKITRGGYVKYNDRGLSDSVKVKK